MAAVVGRGGDGINLPRPGKRGGAFEALETGSAVPGAPAKSVEGWVVFAANLHPEVTEQDLKDLFGDIGTVRKLKRPADTRTCASIGHAFVEFPTYEEAAEAVKNLNGQPFVGDLPVAVSFAFVVPTPEAAAPLEAAAPAAASPETHARPGGDDDAPARKSTHKEASP